MAPVPVLGWALPFALIGHGVCFQLVASPFARIDHRGKTAGTAAGLRSKTSRLRHVREAATTVRPDSSESSGYEQAGGDKRGEAGEGGIEKGKSPVLMEYFIRWESKLAVMLSFRVSMNSCVCFEAELSPASSMYSSSARR